MERQACIPGEGGAQEILASVCCEKSEYLCVLLYLKLKPSQSIATDPTP